MEFESFKKAFPIGSAAFDMVVSDHRFENDLFYLDLKYGKIHSAAVYDKHHNLIDILQYDYDGHLMGGCPTKKIHAFHCW